MIPEYRRPPANPRIVKERDVCAEGWADDFAKADYVAQEQMLDNLRLLCPYLNIEWRKA